MLPILLGASVGQKGRLRPLFVVLGFTLTFSTVALVFGLFPEVLGLSAETLRDAAIALLLVFGLMMISPRPFDWGVIVRQHAGEGQYDQMENAIRNLVAAPAPAAGLADPDLSRIGSPEMYFGSLRLQYLASPQPRELGRPSLHGAGPT